jgi:hypothetical protein
MRSHPASFIACSRSGIDGRPYRIAQSTMTSAPNVSASASACARVIAASGEPSSRHTCA